MNLRTVTLWILSSLILYAAPATAYILVERNPGWAVLLQKEKKVYFEECGSTELTEKELNDLNPDRLLTKCKALSHSEPYAISMNDYRSWVGAHYGIQNPESANDASLSIPSRTIQQILERRDKGGDPSSNGDLENRYVLENLLFTYLDQDESLTLSANNPADRTLRFISVSGLTPSFSNGQAIVKLSNANGYEGCPGNFVLAPTVTLNSLFGDTIIRTSFYSWLKIASRQLGLAESPGSLLTWATWLEARMYKRDNFSGGENPWKTHEDLFEYNVATEQITSRAGNGPVPALCMQSVQPLVSFSEGPIHFETIAKDYQISEAMLYRKLTAIPRLAKALGPLSLSGGGITEKSYAELRPLLDSLLGKTWPRYEMIYGNQEDFSSREIHHSSYYTNKNGDPSHREVLVCNSTPQILIKTAIQFNWGSPDRLPARIWVRLANHCILISGEVSDVVYAYAYATFFWEWGGNISFPIDQNEAEEVTNIRHHSLSDTTLTSANFTKFAFPVVQRSKLLIDFSERRTGTHP